MKWTEWSKIKCLDCMNMKKLPTESTKLYVANIRYNSKFWCCDQHHHNRQSCIVYEIIVLNKDDIFQKKNVQENFFTYMSLLTCLYLHVFNSAWFNHHIFVFLYFCIFVFLLTQVLFQARISEYVAMYNIQIL